MMQFILQTQSDQEVVLSLYGELVGAEVQLLEQEGRRHRQTAYRLVLELDGVPFVGDTGLALLHRWAGPRLMLRGGSPFLRALLRAEGLEVSPNSAARTKKGR